MTKYTSPTSGAAEPDNVTRLPDGSAFAIASFPLPDSHWLYAPREYAEGADEPKELPRPILSHTEHREAVVAAIRYAVRGATMCGKELDFDPDALVQNAVYALCGPFGGRTTLAEKIALAQRFDAADMATAAASGFRDGVASVANQPSRDTNPASKRQAITPLKGRHYNWIGQPERLVYMGVRRYPGSQSTWHQFAKVEAPHICWSEVLTSELATLEETKGTK